MKEIMVLGSGCSRCTKTAELIQAVADQSGVDIKLVKETDPRVMLHYGVLRTPAVIVSGTVVHTGSIPDRDQVTGWLR